LSKRKLAAEAIGGYGVAVPKFATPGGAISCNPIEAGEMTRRVRTAGPGPGRIDRVVAMLVSLAPDRGGCHSLSMP